MSSDGGQQALPPTDLAVEYEQEPINVDPAREPRFSWRQETAVRGVTQTAYRIVVGRDQRTVKSGNGTVWDSGRVRSSRATAVEYDGPDLASDETYYWSVKLWTEGGESDWADPSRFSTALDPEAWTGEWISHQPGVGDTNGWRSRWRDPDAVDEEWVQLDFGETRAVSEIELHPTNPISILRTPDDVAVTMSWFEDQLAEFGFPDAYRIEVSDDPDFDTATTVATHEADPEPDSDAPEGQPDSSVRTRTHGGDGVEGRYLRVTATDLDTVSPSTWESSHAQSEDRKTVSTDEWACFALAALTVVDENGTEMSRNGSVDASSTVESDTWGIDHLVNGRESSELASTSPLLRTNVTLEKPVRSARIHVAAVGYGELYVNGDRVGDRRLDPAWTDYEHRVLYSTFDVSDRLRQGSNALGLWLGRGWYAKKTAYWLADGSPRARVSLSITFEDGTTRVVSSTGDWRASESTLRANDIYDGETYDARREPTGWNSPGFDDETWEPAVVVDEPGGVLRPERIQPMRVVDTVDVETVKEHENGPIIDFRQNLTGWLEIEIDDPDEGEEITLRHAETLTSDGSLSTEDLRTADATDTYIARGAETERYEPRFTYHGFRYAQVSGYPGELDPDDVTAKVVHTAMEPRGMFRCSDDDVNQIQHNAFWGLRSNTHSIPEDCPQRDERFGWTGDAHISTRALLFNFDAVRFDEKWARDHDDVATEMGYVPDVIPNKDVEDPADPTWSITRVMVPWYLYRHDGDIGILREQYADMRAYVDYWYAVTEDGILPAGYGKFGDWLAFENTDGRRGLPHDLYNTAFLYQVTDTFAKIANVLGVEADADAYRDRAETIADAFNGRFFDADEGAYGPGTQSSYSVPLFLALVPEEDTDRVAANLAEKVRSDGNKLKTGFLGTRPLIHTLADHGYEDLAYEVVTQPEQPGWTYMVRQGATTMWERWNSDESVGSGMNSLNHSPFTHVSEFFYEVLAGIRLGDRPVTDHVTIAPALVDDLEWVEAAVETQNGTLESNWKRDGEDGYEVSVTVPWNTHATVRLPDTDDATVVESGDRLVDSTPDGVSSVERNGDELTIEVGSGTYTFEVVRE